MVNDIGKKQQFATKVASIQMHSTKAAAACQSLECCNALFACFFGWNNMQCDLLLVCDSAQSSHCFSYFALSTPALAMPLCAVHQGGVRSDGSSPDERHRKCETFVLKMMVPNGRKLLPVCVSVIGVWF